MAHPVAPAVRVVRARAALADATTVTTGSHVMVTRTARGVTRNGVIARAAGPGPEALVGAVQALLAVGTVTGARRTDMGMVMMSARVRWMGLRRLNGMWRRMGMRMCVRPCGRSLNSKIADRMMS